MITNHEILLIVYFSSWLSSLSIHPSPEILEASLYSFPMMLHWRLFQGQGNEIQLVTGFGIWIHHGKLVRLSRVGRKLSVAC